MGYTHYFKQKKDIPEEQWQALCQQVAGIFPLTQLVSHDMHSLAQKIVICDAWGKKVITQAESLFETDEDGVRIIAFNGHAAQGLDHESFWLSQQMSDEWFCKTAGKPYDWLVTAVLILTHNLCPGCYDISSDGGLEEWLPVLRWLNHYTGVEYLLPLGIISEVFQ